MDGTGVMVGVWFNQPYMASRFVEGERVAFAGRVHLDYGFKQMKDPFVEKLGDEDDPETTSRLIPVHRATEGLTTNWLRRLVALPSTPTAMCPTTFPRRSASSVGWYRADRAARHPFPVRRGRA